MIDTGRLVKKQTVMLRSRRLKLKYLILLALLLLFKLKTELKNKILSFSTLLKKTDCHVKITDLEGKYFTNSDCHKFTNKTKIKNKKLVNKSDISRFNYDLAKKIEILTIKAELKEEQYKLVKLQTYDSSVFYWSKLLLQ